MHAEQLLKSLTFLKYCIKIEKDSLEPLLLAPVENAESYLSKPAN
jgi:hypothetical protein